MRFTFLFTPLILRLLTASISPGKRDVFSIQAELLSFFLSVNRYYSVTIIEVACALCLACWVLHFHHHHTSFGKVPNWVKVGTISS